MEANNIDMLPEELLLKVFSYIGENRSYSDHKVSHDLLNSLAVSKK